jgi:hypothetical protein
MQYDGTRKLNTINQVVAEVVGSTSQLNYQYGPVPYNIEFELHVYVKYNEDGSKILEQILPWFTPDFTPTVDLIPEMNEIRDIPIVIGTPRKEDRYTTDLKTRRLQIWTIPFTVKGYFYGPIITTGIILTVNTSFYIANTANIADSVGNIDVAERFIITPGLDANGDAVHYYGPYPANTTSIPITEIDANSSFGYIETIESVPIGVPRPVLMANN